MIRSSAHRFARKVILGDEFTTHAGQSVYDVALEDEHYLIWLASEAINVARIRAAAQAMLEHPPTRQRPAHLRVIQGGKAS